MYLLNNLRFLEGFRLRFSKNLDYVEAVDDAWTLGINRSFVRRETFRNLLHPMMLIVYLYRGMERVYADPSFGEFTRAIDLPRPVFRYYSLFPANFLEKMKGHAQLFGAETDEPQNMMKALESMANGEPQDFWRSAMKMLRDAYANSSVATANYPQGMVTIPEGDHPKIMREFIGDSPIQRYAVRDQVLELIRSS